MMKGKLGDVTPLEEGIKAAELCALNLIAWVREACPGKDLGCVKKVVKLEGFVNSTSDFVDHPKVINGASDLIVAAFGEDVGAHARFAVGCASLPLGVSVEIGACFELKE